MVQEGVLTSLLYFTHIAALWFMHVNEHHKLGHV